MGNCNNGGTIQNGGYTAIGIINNNGLFENAKNGVHGGAPSKVNNYGTINNNEGGNITN